MKSETNNLWGGRFNEATGAFVKIFGASVSFDKILAFYDIEGSLAHATMLSEVGVLTSNESVSYTHLTLPTNREV